jgi:hypothetical protein
MFTASPEILHGSAGITKLEYKKKLLAPTAISFRSAAKMELKVRDQSRTTNWMMITPATTPILSSIVIPKTN